MSETHLSAATDFTLELDALVRSIAVSHTIPHALFLGAGSSISSGIPSAQRCIWEWKRTIFLSNNPGCESQFAELSLLSTQDKIQRWLDKKGGFPPADSPEEYAFYIEKCYPVAQHRRVFFQEYVQKARPHLGYRLLCLLAESGLMHSVWTTNFDGLVARAAAGFDLSPIEVGGDSQERLPRQLAKGELLCVSMHGDYRYDSLKNTAAELRTQEDDLRAALIRYLADIPLIVSGYSGRDASVMTALHDLFSHSGKGNLYWCGLADHPSIAVTELLESARSNGRSAFYVQSSGFDDLLYRIAVLSLTGEQGENVRKLVEEFGRPEEHSRAQFQVDAKSFQVAIKSNAFPITCPAEALLFEPTEWPPDKRWKWLEGLTDPTGMVAVPFKTKVLCLGTIDEIQTIFSGKIKGPIDRVPIEEKEYRYDDTNTKALFLRAIVRSLAKLTSLQTDNRDFLWDSVPTERYAYGDHTYRIHDAAYLSLRRIADIDYLIIMPSLHVTTLDGNPADTTAVKTVRQAKLGYQHNKPFHEAISSWASRIWKSTGGRIECPPGCGSTFHFQLKKHPVFGKISRPGGKPLTIQPAHDQYYKHIGFQLDEPKLLFSSKSGTGTASATHPIRGILDNRPYDYAITQKGFSSSIRVGVVCTEMASAAFSVFLRKHESTHKPNSTESDYLLDFPGFQSAFGLPLEVARPNDPGWQKYETPSSNSNIKEGALSLARNIIQAITSVRAATSAQVVIICVPSAVDGWTRYETTDELFDLHDFVKAYCVQHGIATQFIQESTCEDKQECRLWWWLSLAIYVKAMRTPWLLDELDPGTAFVGFGVSVNRKAEKGHQVVLGCSHIYNSQGIGLQYRLTKVENPIFIGRRNVFLSKDDADRVHFSVPLHVLVGAIG